MPIAFRDNDDLEELGAAAFLQVESPSPTSAQRLGALLLINARGEPIEFAYNRLELIEHVLWRPLDRATAAVRRLAITLFESISLEPALLLCRADAVPPHLFGEDGQVHLSIPAGRVAAITEPVGYSTHEVDTVIETADSEGEVSPVHVFWSPAPPERQAAELLERLVRRGLVLEPFSRASRALYEVYGPLEDPER